MVDLKNIMKEKGITLIALIITMVVIIIIASVIISVAISGNGLIDMTITAKDENVKGIATETINLKITNVEMTAYIEKHRMPTLKELADNFCEDEDFDKVIEKTEVASLTKITNENPTAIIAKLKQYPYEFEIDSQLRLASIDGIKVASNDDNNIVNVVGYPTSINNITKTDVYQDFSHKKEGQIYIVPEDGYYQIECWGAQGGNAGNYSGGKGTYTSGIIYLTKNYELYFYVGEAGKETGSNGSAKDGGYNGGGNASNTDQWRNQGSGGGATDVRLVGGTDVSWDNFDSLKSRIMVAAGGGGALSMTNGWKSTNGSAGGEFIGNDGIRSNGGSIDPKGGTQTSGGLAINGNTTNAGKFGIGGDGACGSAAGSGYYGGGGGAQIANTGSTGASGSSFISGYGKCDAISQDSTSDNIIHTGQPVHYSHKYFILSTMINGNENMPNHEGNGQIAGNTGNGFAKITKVTIQ